MEHGGGTGRDAHEGSTQQTQERCEEEAQGGLEGWSNRIYEQAWQEQQQRKRVGTSLPVFEQSQR